MPNDKHRPSARQLRAAILALISASALRCARQTQIFRVWPCFTAGRGAGRLSPRATLVDLLVSPRTHQEFSDTGLALLNKAPRFGTYEMEWLLLRNEMRSTGHEEVTLEQQWRPQDLARIRASQFHPSLDELVFVGDLIGKGPSPEEVVRIARKYSAKAVQGNHEYNLLQWRKRGGILPDPEGRIKERYAATVKGLEEDEWDWLESLPLKLQLDLPQSPLPVMVVHAGLVPGVSIEQQEPENLVNLRSFDHEGRASKQYDAGGGGLQREPFAIGLDTGAVYGDELTALLLPKNLDRSLAHLEPQHFAQVRARRAYAQKSDDLKSTQ
eukprot:g32059.t1